MGNMSRYRCPYCKKEFETLPPSSCPGCGKVMGGGRPRDPDARTVRSRKIREIWREHDRRKAELGGGAGISWRGPKFYFGVVVVFIGLGLALFHRADDANARRAETPEIRACRHVDVLAEALGRYHFHTGRYPTDGQGLAALVRNPLTVEGWNGPYINQLRRDPWGTPYGYRAEKDGALPTVYSCGPDRLPGTADDVTPDVTRFDPGTAWTNGWVSEEERLPGVRILKSLRDSD